MTGSAYKHNWSCRLMRLVPVATSAVIATCATATLALASEWKTTVTIAHQCGKASWYGGKFIGKPTANGELYDPRQLTAAHPKLPFGTRVHVKRKKGSEAIVVRINDRGPFIKGRIIDVSEAAAERLGFKASGITQVCIEIVTQ